MTDLFGLVRSNDIEGLKRAIENGADVNAKDEDGDTIGGVYREGAA